MTKNNVNYSKVERLQKILILLASRKKLKIDDLCQVFAISEATARRDLDALAETNKVIRYHGGALYKKTDDSDKSIPDRSQENIDEKTKIGIAAANLIADGETIFLASGTTVHEIAKNLHGKNIVVITNSLLVMNELVDDPSIQLISTGGLLRRSEKSFIGHISEKSIEEIQTDKVFLGTFAINPLKGLTHDFLPEVMTDRAILDLSKKVIVVADYTKFQKTGSAFLAPFNRIDTIVTDSGIDQQIIDEINTLKINLIIS